jgi:hypothetical protein
LPELESIVEKRFASMGKSVWEQSSSDEEPSTYEGPSSLGKHLSHREHNKMMKIAVGNTTTGSPVVGLADEAVPVEAGKEKKAVPVRTDAEGSLIAFGLSEEGTVLHPGPQLAARQWEEYNLTLGRWWTSARVIDGDLANPFQVFPQSFTFAKRVIDPTYSAKSWQLFIPVLALSRDGETIPYQGQEGVDLTTNGLIWVWPSNLILTIALLTAVHQGGKTFTKVDVQNLGSRTPAILKECQKTISIIKEYLGKILNLKTAKRREGYTDRVSEFRVKILAMQSEMDVARKAYRDIQEKFTALLVERDSVLSQYDENYERKKISLDEQLRLFGIDDKPLVAEASQKGPPNLAPRTDPGPSVDGFDVEDFLNGR